jgi:hypothetical protein
MRRSERKRRVWALLSVLALVTALPLLGRAQRAPDPAPEGAQGDVRTRLTGTFRPVSVPHSRERIDAAIERTVSQMMFLIQGIARSRLRDANPVFNSITIRFPPGGIEVVAGLPVRSRDDGTPGTTVGITGAPSRVVQRVTRGRLEQTLTTDEGTRRTEFIASAEGDRLSVRVSISSHQLPVPVQYELLYQR